MKRYVRMVIIIMLFFSFAGCAGRASDEENQSQIPPPEESNAPLLEEGETDLFRSLCTEYIHYIFQVPEELEASGDQVVISFKIDGNRYTYSVK